MSTRAKFIVNSVHRDELSSEEVYNVSAEAVCGGSAENESFFKYTPSGQLTLHGLPKEVAANFQEGKEYYLDITLAE